MLLDVTTASMQELKDEFVRLGGEMARVANARHAINTEIERRVHAIRIKERVRALSDEDKAALRIALDQK